MKTVGNKLAPFAVTGVKPEPESLMKNLFVLGDSFCFHRDQDADWPVHLATLLNLNLQGQGLQGQSWWFIREKLLEFCNSNEFENTELFVFCHTEQNRIIGTSNTIQHSPVEPNIAIVRNYLTYLENKEFNNWCCKQWFKELTELLKNKKVIHLQNFPNTDAFFDILEGVKFNNPILMDISMQEVENINEFLYDRRRNHFSTEKNISLAKKLALTYNKYENAWPNSVQEKMDI